MLSNIDGGGIENDDLNNNNTLKKSITMDSNK